MKATTKGSFYSGTSSIVTPLKQSEFPPEYKGATRLTYYASLFSSVEINSSFYQLPKVATVEKWRESVPTDFRFTFKVPKTITHAKGLAFDVKEVEAFADTVNAIGKKKGCLLLQLPPKVSRELEGELEGLVESLSGATKGWRIAVEFRHQSWYDRAVYRMLEGYGAWLVEQDLPKAPTPRVPVTGDFVYLRFHGPNGGYRGSYEDDYLKGVAKRCKQWMKDGKNVYVYFNNTMGEAVGNLQTLNGLVRG